MDFTREPIIETIITPKDGYKLVVRSSKNAGQEEYFVDAAEIVAFGHALFIRSLERPKAFLVPVSDYEILEVREARMVLKNVGLDRSIKIGGGKDGASKNPREEEKIEAVVQEEVQSDEVLSTSENQADGRPDGRLDKKRDRRRHYRKRRGREDGAKDDVESGEVSSQGEIISSPLSESVIEGGELPPPVPPVFSSLLQPPSTLISETINSYRQNDLFKGAFYLTQEDEYKPHDKVDELLNEDDEQGEEGVSVVLPEPTFESAESNESSESLNSAGFVHSEDPEEEHYHLEDFPVSFDTLRTAEPADDMFEEPSISGEEVLESVLPIYAEEGDPSVKETHATDLPPHHHEEAPKYEKMPKDSHDHFHSQGNEG